MLVLVVDIVWSKDEINLASILVTLMFVDLVFDWTQLVAII